jgi:hypothetical protein
MRRVLGTVLFGLGWVILVYFGTLAFVLLIGFAHAPAAVKVGTAIAFPAGVLLVLSGNWLRERGVMFRSQRERIARHEREERGPFGPPRGET